MIGDHNGRLAGCSEVLLHVRLILLIRCRSGRERRNQDNPQRRDPSSQADLSHDVTPFYFLVGDARTNIAPQAGIVCVLFPFAM
jgi:hypothetical protein